MDPNTAPDFAFNFEALHSAETLRVVRLVNELALALCDPPATNAATVAGDPPATNAATVAGEPPATNAATVAGEPPAANAATVAGEPPLFRLRDVRLLLRVLDVAVPEHVRTLTPLVLASALACTAPVFAGIEAYVEADRTLLGSRLETSAPRLALAYRELTSTYFALESAGFIADAFTQAFRAWVAARRAPWSLHLWGNLSSLAVSVIAEAYRDKPIGTKPEALDTFLCCTLSGFSGDTEHFAHSLHTLAAAYHGVARFALDASSLPAPLVLSDAAMRALPTAVHELELNTIACSQPAALALIARCDPKLTLMRLRLRALSNVATGAPVLDDECGRALYGVLAAADRSKDLLDLEGFPHCMSEELCSAISHEMQEQTAKRLFAKGRRASMFEYRLS